MTAAAADGHQPPTLRNEVAEDVRVWLARRRMSGAELSRRVGRSQTFIAKRLDGRQAMDLDDLEMIARALGISVLELISDAARRASLGDEDDESGRAPISADTLR